MKKWECIVLVFVMLLGVLSVGVCAAETPQARVSVSVKGTLVATETIAVVDTDNDGVLTVSDALYGIHEAAYNGGASKGYRAYQHDEYGLSLGMLWGDESGNFGYYLNDASAFSLSDVVKDGDHLMAFVYKDTTAYSDMYTYFDQTAAVAEVGEQVTLTLSSAGFDANWNPITAPVAGAVITLNGKETTFVTDENGRVKVSVDQADDYLVSAVSDKLVMVPPVCEMTVNTPQTTTTVTTEVMTTTSKVETKGTTASQKESPKTADTTQAAVACGVMLVGIGVCLTMRKRGKHVDETL